MGDWVFIAPVGNLVLTSAVENEFRIGNVLFVGKAKLPRIRKRLGINAPLSRLKKAQLGDWYTEFLSEADTYAVIRRKGSPKAIERPCFDAVREALTLLALSQLGYSRRRSKALLGLFGEHQTTRVERILLNRRTPAKSIGGRVTRGLQPLVLDANWVSFMKAGFFFKLLKLLSEPGHVGRSWQASLKRAAILVGQSFSSYDVPTAFLLNVIGLETLLTQRGDRLSDVVPRRIEAFLGWVGFWQTQGFERRIAEIYEKRSAFVHAGESQKIAPSDILFTDDLLFNLLVNLVAFHRRFASKESVFHFADQVQAERTLGVKPRVRPKRLVFFSRRYTKEDLGEI